MIVPELLAPAGNLEKLKTALRFGADAVYCGIEQFSLRALAGNLTLQELSQGCEIAHSHGKKLYLTLNVFLRPGEEIAARELLETLRPIPVDAYILSDPGMLHLVHQVDPEREVHLSTQATAVDESRQDGIRDFAINLAHHIGHRRTRRNPARHTAIDNIGL